MLRFRILRHSLAIGATALACAAVSGCAADEGDADGEKSVDDANDGSDPSDGANGDATMASAGDDVEDEVGTTEAAASVKAPSCVKYYKRKQRFGTDFVVTNLCSSTKTIRLDLALMTDTPCRTLARGKATTYWLTDKAAARFRQVALCKSY